MLLCTVFFSFRFVCLFLILFCLPLDFSIVFFSLFVGFTVDGGAAAPAAVTTVQCSYDSFSSFFIFHLRSY